MVHTQKYGYKCLQANVDPIESVLSITVLDGLSALSFC